jgi:hypothetical protein
MSGVMSPTLSTFSPIPLADENNGRALEAYFLSAPWPKDTPVIEYKRDNSVVGGSPVLAERSPLKALCGNSNNNERLSESNTITKRASTSRRDAERSRSSHNAEASLAEGGISNSKEGGISQGGEKRSSSDRQQGGNNSRHQDNKQGGENSERNNSLTSSQKLALDQDGSSTTEHSHSQRSNISSGRQQTPPRGQEDDGAEGEGVGTYVHVSPNTFLNDSLAGRITAAAAVREGEPVAVSNQVRFLQHIFSFLFHYY